jgi:hypothetical protein
MGRAAILHPYLALPGVRVGAIHPLASLRCAFSWRDAFRVRAASSRC